MSNSNAQILNTRCSS